MRSDRTPQFLLAMLVVILVGGYFLPLWAQFLLTIALAKGLVVLGLLPLMRTGLVSFGQALYYCLGAYAGGALGLQFGITDLLLMMLAGGVAAGVLAALLGFLLARYRGIFFGLLSLALSMILYGLLVKTESLGYTHGFNVEQFTLFGVRPDQPMVRYSMLVAAAVVCTGAALALHRYLGTPLGLMAPAIRDNEIRVEYMGGSARYAIHVIYIIGATLAGAAGALVAGAVGHIDPEMAYWTQSGEFVFIAILAGTGSVIAPFLGALIFGVIHSFAFDFSPNTWQMVLGTALLLIIVFLPSGLWSLFGRRFKANEG
jgi:ABC-type branched-subunit amino acid transport system permease subunit